MGGGRDIKWNEPHKVHPAIRSKIKGSTSLMSGPSVQNAIREL